MSDIVQIWEKLKGKRAVSGYFQLRIRPEAACGLFLALRKPDGNLCFIVETAKESLSPELKFESSDGYTIDVGPAGKKHPNTLQIIIECKHPQFNDLFIALIEDVIDSVASKQSESQCVNELSARLFKWMRFMQRHGLEGLGDKQQQGLYGELFFLDSILIPTVGMSKGIEGWVGPQGKNQDFQLDDASVEVKTTSSNSPDIVHISNIGQLDPVASPSLFLLHIAFDVRRGDQNTLPALIDAIRKKCAADGPRLQQAFEEQLMESGYLDTHASRYEHTQYTVKKLQFYKVGKGFPQLKEAELPTGICDVKYSLSLSACASFRIDESDVINSIGGK